MASSLVYIVLGLALLIYMVVRQFIEQTITLRSLLLLPALLTYLTYTNVMQEFTVSIVNPALLIAALMIGLLIGSLIGFYRGGLMRIRMDTMGNVFAKASLANISIWLGLLVVRIIAASLFYSGMAQMSITLTLIVAVISTLFLGNIIATNVRLFLRASRYPLADVPRMHSQHLV